MARAANNIVELASDAIPMFADPEREYCHVVGLCRHRRIEGGRRRQVAGSAAEIRMRAWYPRYA
jgi:hypothetical protein